MKMNFKELDSVLFSARQIIARLELETGGNRILLNDPNQEMEINFECAIANSKLVVDNLEKIKKLCIFKH